MDGLFDGNVRRTAGERILLFAPQLLIGLLIWLASWIAGAAAFRLIGRLGSKRSVNPDVVYVVGRAAKLSLITLGVVTALGTIGVDVAALVAGVGLTGLVLGIALKDTVSNALAGILILVYKPFHRQDLIRVTDFQGTVVQIDLRYTTLEMEDRRILIPNASLFTNAITVYTRKA